MKKQSITHLILCLLLFGQTAFTGPGAVQPIEGATAKLLINGKVIPITNCYPIKELAGKVSFETSFQLEEVRFYIVRKNRPVKAVTLEGGSSLETFDLSKWAEGTAEAGDRIAMQIMGGNQEASASLNLCDK